MSDGNKPYYVSISECFTQKPKFTAQIISATTRLGGSGETKEEAITALGTEVDRVIAMWNKAFEEIVIEEPI